MNLRQVKDRMEWRGITIKDLVYAGGAIALIVTVTGILVYGLIASLIS